MEDTDSEVRARAMFYLDELRRKTGEVVGSQETDIFDGAELNMEEVDYIEAFLQVILQEKRRF